MSAAWGGVQAEEDAQIGRTLLYAWAGLSIAAVSLMILMVRAGVQW